VRRRGLIAAALATSASPAFCAAARCAVPDPPPPTPPPRDGPSTELRTGRQLAVRTFGAVGDGRHDDTAALQRAFAALRPGDTLHFGAGRFVHASRLVVAAPGAHLLAEGATLHATNPADQALLIQADGVVVRGFTLTAVTDRRRDAPWESRIAIWRDGPAAARATNGVHILDNRIVEAGPAPGRSQGGPAPSGGSERSERGGSDQPGTALANSSSSAAIFVHHAQGFTIARNLVRRPLADAIHVTGGSSQGRVIGNTVRESGDDMVAVVSYLPSASERARGVPTLVRDVLIADNDLAGQYWGRGISVVGGEAVTIQGNRIDAATHAAGVYIAREAVYRTHGVRNVRVSGNTITRIQTVAPEYSALEPARAGVRTGHGAIEVVAQIADDERPSAGRGLGIDGVLIDGNVVHDVGTDGIRIGDGWGRRSSIERPRPEGAPQTVDITAAPVRRITIRGNRLGAIKHAALVVFNAADPARALVCEDNTLDGRPLVDTACAATARPRPAAGQGSTLRCESKGLS
jgi:Right handed beta helix region/Pectate lyase superfamily protein